MKFSYTYRTSDNAVHDGVISASSRDDVYQLLKPKGIKPYNVQLVPGFANRIASIGKRGIAIVALSLGVIVALMQLHRTQQKVEEVRREVTVATEPRHQIAALPKDWRETFSARGSSPTDMYFALFAQPGNANEGVIASSFGDELEAMPMVAADDPAWLAELKRIVAGMKIEALAMRRAGKSDIEIALWLTERQRMESSYRDQLIMQLRTGQMPRADVEKALSAMGLRPPQDF